LKRQVNIRLPALSLRLAPDRCQTDCCFTMERIELIIVEVRKLILLLLGCLIIYIRTRDSYLVVHGVKREKRGSVKTDHTAGLLDFLGAF
jgi:hypothetical protein